MTNSITISGEELAYVRQALCDGVLDVQDALLQLGGLAGLLVKSSGDLDQDTAVGTGVILEKIAALFLDNVQDTLECCGRIVNETPEPANAIPFPRQPVPVA